MIWEHKTRLLLYKALEDKLSTFTETSWLTYSEAQRTKKPKTNPSKWNKYIEELGCKRIIRNKITGWEYEDNKEKPNGKWKSLNQPGFVHVGNPIWTGTADKCEHVLRIPKEVAEKILVLGMP